MKLKIDISKGDRKVFFCSDLHLFHSNVITHDKRPFLFDKKIGYPEPGSKDKSNLNVELMNETLIENWNNVVAKDDIVFYLGDFSFRGVEATKEIANQLNGTIHFIMGNHDDYKVIKGTERFESISDYIEAYVRYGSKKEDKVMICMMHYPISSWNRQHFGSFHIHGHSHQNKTVSDPVYYTRKVIDVGCNGWEYEPVDFWTIKSIMDSKVSIAHTAHED